MRKVIFSLLSLVLIIIATIIIIAFGRGYRFNTNEKAFSSTGLLLASSDPTGASVFVKGKLKTITNNSISLSPGWYEVKITKEGFLPWEKKMRVQGEVVSETQAFLFPSTPSLTALTNTGVIAPSVSPDGTKIAYAVPKSAGEKAGLWVLNLTSSPLGFSRDPQLIASSNINLDWTQATFSWSTDSKKILANIGSYRYLLESDKENIPVSLSEGDLTNLKESWNKDLKDKETERLAAFPPEFARVATESAKIIDFSPDETKILYQATASAILPQFIVPAKIGANSTPEERDLKPDKIYVYDLKEDKNYQISNLNPPAGGQISNLVWFPTSRHLILVEADKISILDYDDANKTTIYSGPFEKFVSAAASGRKIIILTSYNRGSGGTSNLYSINLR